MTRARTGQRPPRRRGPRLLPKAYLLLATTLLLGTVLPPQAGAAPVTAHRGERWSTTLNQNLAGCVSAKTNDPTFHVATGVGRWKGTSRADSCPPSRGGRATLSESEIFTELEVDVPVHFNRTSTGVRANWTLAFNISTFGATRIPSYVCPTTYYNYSFYDAYYNYTYLYRYVAQDCEVLGQVDVAGYAYLVDTTTGATRYGTSWTGFSNSSGFAVDAYEIRTNYSGNSTFWPSNNTVQASYNGSWGAAATLSEQIAPCWWVNGTFAPHDHYQVQLFLDLSVVSEVYDVPGAAAGAVFDARTPGEHLDLVGVQAI